MGVVDLHCGEKMRDPLTGETVWVHRYHTYQRNVEGGGARGKNRTSMFDQSVEEEALLHEMDDDGPGAGELDASTREVNVTHAEMTSPVQPQGSSTLRARLRHGAAAYRKPSFKAMVAAALARQPFQSRFPKVKPLKRAPTITYSEELLSLGSARGVESTQGTSPPEAARKAFIECAVGSEENGAWTNGEELASSSPVEELS